eukprot:4646098-Amphidinium_carterae.4
MLCLLLYREFRKQALSLYPLAEVKSAMQLGVLTSSSKRRKIAQDVGFTITEGLAGSSDPGPQVGYAAMVGTADRNSKVRVGDKVKDGDFSEGLAYMSYCSCSSKAMDHPSPQSETVKWLIDCDHQTRAKARSLHLEGWPWCDALRVAREVHLAVSQHLTPRLPGPREAAPRSKPIALIRHCAFAVSVCRMASSAEAGNTMPFTAPTAPIVEQATVGLKAQGSPRSRASPPMSRAPQLTHLSLRMPHRYPGNWWGRFPFRREQQCHLGLISSCSVTLVCLLSLCVMALGAFG